MSKLKLTASEKREKKRRRNEYMTIFVNGKQKRIKRPATIEGMDVDEFIRRNADPIWLHQNGMWVYLEPLDMSEDEQRDGADIERRVAGSQRPGCDLDDSDFDDGEIPF